MSIAFMGRQDLAVPVDPPASRSATRTSARRSSRSAPRGRPLCRRSWSRTPPGRVRRAAVPDVDLVRQQVAVDAFFAAARGGDFDALLALLDPDVVVRADYGALLGGSREVRGARAVADETLKFSQFAAFGRRALVNGAAGIVAAQPGRPYSVMGFIVRQGTIAEIDILADPARLGQLDLAGLDR